MNVEEKNLQKDKDHLQKKEKKQVCILSLHYLLQYFLFLLESISGGSDDRHSEEGEEEEDEEQQPVKAMEDDKIQAVNSTTGKNERIKKNNSI